MKNFTPKLILTLMSCLSFTILTAQQSQKIANTPNNPYGVELNDDSQSFLNENGVVRCLSEEMNRKYDEANPNKQNFEEWLAPLIEERKQLIAAQSAAGTYVAPPPYEIPIIFHVVSGSPGDAADLDAQYVNAQIDQLNIDFGAQDTDIPGSIWAGVAADAQIVFVPAQVDPSGAPLAEPGINRVYGYPGQLSTTDFDNTIKPATIWDRTRYCNNWTANLGGGLLGYAQFPEGSTLPGMPTGNEPDDTDGTVNLYTSIGSEALPNPGGGVFGAGRTLTHELGHWLGLRHIWGDGNCGQDDFCNDTPNQGGSSSGCPTTADTCAGGNRDMVENFMDYSNDTCMFLFTIDQVARIQTVMENSPGRVELSSSTAGQALPQVSFAGTEQSDNEGTDCSFTDITVNMVIGDGASANADATISVAGGTATENTDFQLITTGVTFAAGSTAGQTVTLRVFNDSEFEGNETIDLTFTLNANGGDATVGNDMYTITINDDDINPDAGGAPISLFTDDFESGLGNWTVTGPGSATNFAVTNNAGFPDAGFFNSDQSNTTNYVFVNDDDCNCDMSQERIAMANPLDLSTYSEVYVTLDYVHDNEYVAAEFASIEASTDNGATWTQVQVLDPDTVSGNSVLTFQSPVIDASAFAGQSNVIFSVFYNDGADWGQGIIFDDFEVYTRDASAVQTAMNAGSTNDQMQVLGTGMSNAFDTASNDIILSIDNTGNLNYGCTSASVSRAGTSAQSYNGSIAPALVMDKTYTVTPATTNSTGATTISFYMTEAELDGWETATADSRNNLRIQKDNGTTQETVTATISPFGSNFRVSGNFTSGINGTYYFGNVSFLGTSSFEFNNFAMYPNPVQNELTLSFDTNEDVAVSFFDMRGRNVMTKSFNQNGSTFNQSLNMNAVSTGIYIVKIESGSNIMFRKLVKK